MAVVFVQSFSRCSKFPLFTRLSQAHWQVSMRHALVTVGPHRLVRLSVRAPTRFTRSVLWLQLTPSRHKFVEVNS